MIKVKCHNCGYEWNYGGIMKYVTCPSCLNKTEVKKEEQKEDNSVEGIEVQK